MSEHKERPTFEFHFHDKVGQNIANVEHMEVHFDKDMQMQVTNVEEMSATTEKTDIPQNADIAEDSNTQNVPSELSPSRKRIMEQLLSYIDEGDWLPPATSDNVKHYLKTILGAGDECLAASDWEACANLWKLLEQGRGDRVVIVMQNLIGFFVSCGWLPKGSPALNKAFFGNEDGYSNIDKGNPNRTGMSEGFKSVQPILEKYKSVVAIDNNTTK